MKIEIGPVGDVRILDCSGRIELGEGMLATRDTSHDIRQCCAKRIIPNLAT